MDENEIKFEEKIAKLLDVAKNNNNSLRYEDIIAELPDTSVDGELFDRVLEELEKARIEIIPVSDNDMSDDPVLLEDIDDVDRKSTRLNSSH